MIYVVRVLTVLCFLLAGGVLVLCAARKPWKDPGEAVARPSALALSAQHKDERQDTDRDQVPPLIQAAESFAAYLNPPPALPPTQVSPVAENPTPVDVQPIPASAPFELQGISYHPARPEESLALVWLVADGQRWVRQGTQLGHCIIERISPCSVVYSNAGQRQEMALMPSAIPEQYAEGRDTKPSDSVSVLTRMRGAPRAPGAHLAARDPVISDGRTP